MGKQRQSNYELLRVILMMIVPLYHLMIYSGITSMPYNNFTVPGLMICCGGGVMADYAFMAISAWFFLETKERPVISRAFGLASQVLFMYLIKYIMVRKVLGFGVDNFYVNDFIMDGSWWFIYIYFVVLFIYPILNKVIYSVHKVTLVIICLILFVWFIINGITYETSFLNDLISFLVTYFIIGCIKRLNVNNSSIKHYRFSLLSIIMCCYFVTLFFACFLKYPGNFFSEELASEIVRNLVGRYSITQFFMGISLFLLFQTIHINYNKRINEIAKNVFYVFLMHETVMAIFWRFNKIRTLDNQLPYHNIFEFVFWCFIYILACFLFAGVVRFLYVVLFEKWIQKIIHTISDYSIIKKVERKYIDFTS